MIFEGVKKGIIFLTLQRGFVQKILAWDKMVFEGVKRVENVFLALKLFFFSKNLGRRPLPLYSRNDSCLLNSIKSFNLNSWPFCWLKMYFLPTNISKWALMSNLKWSQSLVTKANISPTSQLPKHSYSNESQKLALKFEFLQAEFYRTDFGP